MRASRSTTPVEHLAHFNLSVLPAGGPAVAPYEVLKSLRLEALLGEARQCYDYIVLDTPPFVPVPGLPGHCEVRRWVSHRGQGRIERHGVSWRRPWT